MARLGEYGAARREADPDVEPDTFLLCGVEFTASAEVDPLAVLEFAEAAAAGLEGEDAAGMAAMLSLIRSAVEESEWPRFRAVVRRHRPGVDVLIELATAVVQRETGRPTQRPADSSAGPSTTGETSKEPSSSEAPLSPIQRDPRVLELVPVDKAALDVLTAVG